MGKEIPIPTITDELAKGETTDLERLKDVHNRIIAAMTIMVTALENAKISADFQTLGYIFKHRDGKLLKQPRQEHNDEIDGALAEVQELSVSNGT